MYTYGLFVWNKHTTTSIRLLETTQAARQQAHKNEQEFSSLNHCTSTLAEHT